MRDFHLYSPELPLRLFFGRIQISKTFMRFHSITASLWQSFVPLSKYCQICEAKLCFCEAELPIFICPLITPSSEMCCFFAYQCSSHAGQTQGSWIKTNQGFGKKKSKKTSTPPTMDMVILYKEHEQNKICLGNQLCDSHMLKLRNDTNEFLGKR